MILLYGFEICHIKKADLRSLDFVIDRLYIIIIQPNIGFTLELALTVFTCPDMISFHSPQIVPWLDDVITLGEGEN